MCDVEEKDEEAKKADADCIISFSPPVLPEQLTLVISPTDS